MSEIAVQVASRYLKRKQSDAVGKNLLKTLTEPITNSDDSYRRITESESGVEKSVFPITVFADKTNRVIRIIDLAEGMTANELERKFEEYGAAKSGAYKGYSDRGIFGQGLSDVLFYHKDGKIKTVKNGEASLCNFYWKNDKQYIGVESVKISNKKIKDEWGIVGDRGTVIEFVLDNTVLHDYENLEKRMRVFYMLRLINSNDRREIRLVYKDRKGTKESHIKYDFPKGDLVDTHKFSFEFENYNPVTVDIQLYKSSTALPMVGDERENGLLVYDEKEAVYDQTFFGLDDLPGTDKFFGTMKLTGARDIILDKINDKKHPEEILSDTRDGFNKQHDFYKQLAIEVKDWLHPILSDERQRRNNEGIEESTIERHQKAFEELNKLYKELTGEDVSGTIRTKKKTRPTGGLQFARNNITVTVGKRYGIQLLIDTRVIEPGSIVKLDASKKVIGFSPREIVVDEVPEESDWILNKTVFVTGSKSNTADTLEATVEKRKASVVISVVSEEIVYPEKGIVFSPEYVRTVAEKDSTLHLYIDLTTIKKGTKITFTSTNDTIKLKKSKIPVPNRMRTTSKVARIEVPFRGTKNEESGIIEASVGEYLAQCRIDVKDRQTTPPSGVTGLFKDWDFDDGLSKSQQSALDPVEGSPTQGFILINSAHPINKRYFGEDPQKKHVVKSHKAQLYLAELILNEALGRMINEAYQKGVIPSNYGAGIDIPFYVAEKKFELGSIIYDCFVEPEPTKSETKRAKKLKDVMQDTEMDEAALLENMKERPRTMVEMYFGLGEQRRHTLEEIATRAGVTRERVRQIINKALAATRAKEQDEEVAPADEVNARDYILEEDNRLKSEAENIIEVTARIYGVTSKELHEHTRKATIVVPRQVAMYLLRTELGFSFPAIGQLLDRDHTTVIYACNKAKEIIEKSAKVKNRIERIKKIITAG